jgi:cytoskeleton protein RodZ
MNVGPLMNEPYPALPETMTGETPAARHGGELLRQRREALGMHVVGLSAVLKVPVARLQALEEGRFDELPNLIFARALAGSVCRTLKLDPAAVLAGMPLPPATPDVRPVKGLDTPIETRAELAVIGERPRRQRRVWAVLGLLLVLALLALGAWWWQTTEDEAGPAWESPVAQGLPLGESGAAAAVPAATEATAPVDPGAAVTAGQVPAVRLSVTGVTWVQVTGATGALRLERVLQAGETLEAGDDLPLRVVVGRADVTQVWVRGERFDLTPVTRNQVARFEVR